MFNNLKEKPICLIDICKGYCCEHFSKVVSDNLKVEGLRFEMNLEGDYRCLFHDKNSGKCLNYEKRASYCRTFYCPSASRGYMRNLAEIEGRL